MEELERTSGDQAGVEGLQSFNFAQFCSSNRRLLQQNRQRPRARLHLALSSLKGQSTEDNATLQQSQDVVADTSKNKTSRKVIPSKMTSEAIKEFYNFAMSTRKSKGQKQNKSLQNLDGAVDAAMDHSPETSNVATVSSADCRNELPSTGIAPSSQMQGPVLLNIDSQGNPTQIPFMTPHVLPLPGGGQPALVFFVGSPSVPATGELPGVTNMASTTPFGNAMFFTQPVTLNVVPQDAASSGGVIEKAMELAQFQTNPIQTDNQPLSQNTTELVVSESGFVPPNASCNLQSSVAQGPLTIDSSFSTLPQVSQNVVITHSVAAGDNVPIDNVSQSVTVQTSQIMQNQSLADLRSFLEEARAELADRSAMSAETDQYDTAGPKLIYKRKGLRVREVMTQTGADPEIVIISERKLDCDEDVPVEEPVENSNTNRTVKKPVSARVRRFGCDKCEKKFYTNNDLRRHQTSHQESRPFTCEECQKGFRTSSELTLHKAIHVEVKQYKCEFCGKEFRTKGCIKSHIKYHIGDKRHKCTECDRAFVKSADLKRHMAGHRNEKKFVCDDCGSAFTRRDNLKAHRLLHTRESVVTCDLCSKEFINAVYLKRHMHIHKQAKKKPYECQWCPKTYEQLEGLRRHIRQHVGDEKFVCKDCGKKFITSIQLKRHLWLSHDQDSPYRRSIL
ncbi:hypothetical protein ACROYT_G011627 [Oculina patagonica]